MRLIDADNALELFRAEYQNTENLIKQGEKQLDSLAEGYTEAAHIIKHISPTVDAVPVETLKQWLTTIPFHDISNGNGACLVCFRKDFEAAIKRLNSFRETREPVGPMKLKVARRTDAVPVVRCRECKFYQPEYWDGIQVGFPCKADGGMTDPTPESYCNLGERRKPDGKE